MFNINYLVRLVLKVIAIKTLNRLLFLSLFFLANISISFYVIEKIGFSYTMLAIMVCNLLIFRVLKRMILKVDEEIKVSVKRNIYPEIEMYDLCALYVIAPLLLAPGFLTFFISMLIVFLFRQPFGKYMTKKLSIDNVDLYEYLKLQDFTLNEELSLKYNYLKEQEKNINV